MEDFWVIVFEHLSKPVDFRSLGLTCKAAYLKLVRFEAILHVKVANHAKQKEMEESSKKVKAAMESTEPVKGFSIRYKMYKWLQSMGLDEQAEDFKNGKQWWNGGKIDWDSHNANWKKIYELYKDEYPIQ